MIEVFLADAPELLTRVDKALEAGDGPGLRAAAHTLKGAVSNFAAPQATRAAVRLQQIAEGETLEGAGPARDALGLEIERVKKELEALL